MINDYNVNTLSKRIISIIIPLAFIREMLSNHSTVPI